MIEETDAWRDKLEPGDTVIVSGRDASAITQVARVTKTQIVTKNGYRFSRVGGHEIGSSSKWFTQMIEYPAPIRLDMLRARDHRRRLIEAVRQRYEKATTSALEQIMAMLDTDTKEASNAE